MRILAFAAAVCLALAVISVSRGQELERVLPLPDTFLSMDSPELVAYNPANNQFYFASDCDSAVIAIDGTTLAKVGIVYLPCCVEAIGCDPATNKVYFAMDNDAVAIVDGRTNRLLTYVTVGEAPIAFGCDTLANKVYCGNYDSDNITVIDGRTNRVLTTIDHVYGPVAFCCVPNAGKVYCGTDIGFVVIDSRTDSIRTAQQTPRRRGCFVGIARSPVQNRVYIASDDTVSVLDGASDSVIARVEPSRGYSFWVDLVYGAALDQVYTLDDDGDLIVIDCGGDSIVDRIQFAPNWSDEYRGALWADPFAGKVYCSDYDDAADTGCITCCDVAQREVAHIPAGLEPLGMAVSTKAHQLVAADDILSCALVLDTEHDSLLATIELYDCPTAIKVSTDGKKLYVGCYSGDLLVLDALTGGLRTRLHIGDQVDALCFGPSGRRLYCASTNYGGGQSPVMVVDAEADTPVAHLAVGASGAGPLRFYPDSMHGKLYCTGHYNTTIDVIDDASSSVKGHIDIGGQFEVACLDPVAGRLYVYNWNYDRAPRLWVSVVDCGLDSIIAEFTVPSGLSALCSDPGRGDVYASEDGRDTVLVIDGGKDSVVAAIAVAGQPSTLCYDPVHDRMYCALCDSCQVAAIDCATRSVIARFRAESPEYWHDGPNLCYNPASGHIFCAQYCTSAVAVVDPTTNSVMTTIPVRGQPAGFSTSRTGEEVYVNCSNSFISVIRDQLPPTATTGAFGSTLFKGSVFLRGNDPTRLVNSAGRVVATLKPGNNAVNHLAAGVYFALPTGSARRPSKLVVVK